MTGSKIAFPVLGRFILALVFFSQLLLQGFASPVISSVAGSNDHDGYENDKDTPALKQAPLENSRFAAHDADYDEEKTTSLTYPSWHTSVLLARRLLALSTTGVVSTIFPDPLPSTFPYKYAPPEIAGKTLSMKEYIADCDEHLVLEEEEENDGKEERGNPIFLALHVATTFRNIATSSNNISLSIDWWDHLKDTKPIYPGLPLSPAGLPRVTLFGYVEPIEDAEKEKKEDSLRQCYLKEHPDAEIWLPGQEDSPHSSFWARFVVRQAYWVGGFGDVARIGWLDISDWKKIGKHGSEGGWGDVRLPGE